MKRIVVAIVCITTCFLSLLVDDGRVVNSSAKQSPSERVYTDEAAYKEAVKQYQAQLKLYQALQAQNAFLKKQYEEQLRRYQVDIVAYQQAKQVYDLAKAEEAENQKQYEQDLENWEQEKELYDAAFAQAQAKTTEEGHLSQVEAQYFIFQSEPNAQVSFQGVDSFIDASHDFGEWLVGIGGDISTLPLTNQPVLFQGVGSATPTGSSDGYGLILEKNKPIQVIYTGLQQTSYRGQRIDTVVYTYELLSTYATDNRATAFIFKDPTKTIYIGSFGDNQGNVDVAFRQTITYYYENGEAVTFAPDAAALLSLASRNNNYSIGEQEYVVMSSGMTFIPITGSSVTEENSYIASRTSNAHV